MSEKKSGTAETPADDPRGMEQQWQDLSEKELLIGVLTELQQIRLLLQGAENDESERTDGFACDLCGEVVQKDDRHTHAVSGHNVHSSEVDSMFSEA
jgi:hypothetical protein